MNAQATVNVIACGALHDEMPGRPKNFCFEFCRSNVICSHGNEKLALAIAVGLERGILEPAQAQKMLETIEATQLELSRWTDMISVLRKQMVERAPGENHLMWRIQMERVVCPFPSQEATQAAEKAALDLDVTELNNILKGLLGDDTSKWRDVHKQRQIEIAEPILEITRTLGGFGLIQLNPEPIIIPSESLLDLARMRAGDKKLTPRIPNFDI